MPSIQKEKGGFYSEIAFLYALHSFDLYGWHALKGQKLE